MDAWKIGLLLIGVALVVWGSWALVRRRRTIWQKFARRYGLEYSNDAQAGPRAVGQIHGLAFELRKAESSDSGPLGVEEIWMAVRTPCPPPEGVRIERAGRVEHMVRDITAGESLATQDPFFDQHFIVQAEDQELAQRYLTPQRRQALVPLAELPVSCHAGLAGPLLYCQDREMVASFDRLQQRCELLCQVAQKLGQT